VTLRTVLQLVVGVALLLGGYVITWRLQAEGARRYAVRTGRSRLEGWLFGFAWERVGGIPLPAWGFLMLPVFAVGLVLVVGAFAS
jgi:hypothetical protein